MEASRNATPADGTAEHDWFLSHAERGNDATSLPAWTSGNLVEPLVDGRAYFGTLDAALSGADRGDLVLFAAWSGNPGERLTDDGPTVAETFSRVASRGVLLKGLVWRSPEERLGISREYNHNLSEEITGEGAEVVLDQRVRMLGSHHQKFVVVRHARRPDDDVALVGSFDFALSRRDSSRHEGDRQSMQFGRRYGSRPSWHDTHALVRGPAVADVETVFRDRWADQTPLSLLPWQAVPDLVRRWRRRPSELPPQLPAPSPAGSCSVQLLQTYPAKRPRYPFAPAGERSIARGHAKALRLARRLVYVEEQFLWSEEVAAVFADALREAPDLQLVLVLPRVPKKNGRLASATLKVGQARALRLLRAAGGDRVHVFDVVNHEGDPVYVHAKITVVDDTWACVRSDNLNRRSWTHDSELSAAVLDTDRDPRSPTDAAGLGYGARRFARDLRLRLLAEHLDRADGGVDDLLAPDDAVAAMRRSADALDEWHRGGRAGTRPPGRLRNHPDQTVQPWLARLVHPVYRRLVDPDGRPRPLRRRGGW